jgi:hypothetical protein
MHHLLLKRLILDARKKSWAFDSFQLANASIRFNFQDGLSALKLDEMQHGGSQQYNKQRH